MNHIMRISDFWAVHTSKCFLGKARYIANVDQCCMGLLDITSSPKRVGLFGSMQSLKLTIEASFVPGSKIFVTGNAVSCLYHASYSSEYFKILLTSPKN